MKHFIWYVLIQLTGIIVTAQEYTPTDAGSSVTFKIKNLGFNSEGSFKGLAGKIRFDPKDPSKTVFDVSVDANTVNTDNDMRDDHLRKTEYFDVQNHPRIRFVSTAVTASGKSGTYQVAGRLTIKDTTRDISFPFIATPMGNDYIFSGQFTINRRDFGVGGSSTISNNLTVSLTVFAKKT